MDGTLTVGAHALGTPETAWSSCPRLASCPPLAIDVPRRVVVLAPHPDDEVLGVGGLMRQLVRMGAALTLIAITDGEGCHPRSPTTSAAQLAALRAAERARALRALEVDGVEVVRLGIADGGVAAAFELPALLLERLRHVELCMAPWEHDGHPDHDATGRAALHACGAAQVPLVRYPVWAWHWARPASDDLPWARARRVELAADTVEAKHAAIAQYRSQYLPLSAAPGDEAILLPPVLARFHRPFEVVFV